MYGVCAVTVGGRQLLAAAGDGTVRLWDPSTGKQLRTLQGHTGRVTGVCAVSVDGRPLLVSTGNDGTVRLWDPGIGRCGTISPCPTRWPQPPRSHLATSSSPVMDSCWHLSSRPSRNGKRGSDRQLTRTYVILVLPKGMLTWGYVKVDAAAFCLQKTTTGTARAPVRSRFDLLNTYFRNEPGETFCLHPERL